MNTINTIPDATTIVQAQARLQQEPQGILFQLLQQLGQAAPWTTDASEFQAGYQLGVMALILAQPPQGMY